MANKTIKQFTEKDAIKQALETIDSYPESERPKLRINYERPDGSLRSGTYKLISYDLEEIRLKSVLNGITDIMGLSWILCLDVVVEE